MSSVCRLYLKVIFVFGVDDLASGLLIFWTSHKEVGFPLHLFLHSTISGRIPALAILSEFLFLVFCLKFLLTYPISQNGGEALGKAPFLFLSAGPRGGGSCLWSPCGPTPSPLSPSCTGLFPVLWTEIHAQFCFLALDVLSSMSRAACSPTLTPTLSYCFVIFRCLFKYHFLLKLFPDSLHGPGPRASDTFPS